LLHPNYSHYSPATVRRLDGLYGAVDARANQKIASLVVGEDVLDLGCGFGSLVEHLRLGGRNAIGIDLLEHQIVAGRRRFPSADLRVVEPGPLPFSDQSFDTVVLKESLHHLAAEGEIEESMREVARVCRRRVIVFEPNPSVILRLGRTLIGHVDPVCPPPMAQDFLKLGGFTVLAVTYSDALAFPLSGGYVARPLAPRSAARILFALDDALVHLFGRRLAWRYTIVADRTTQAA
jgi:ubiquinone/menaquinone biosynthesis C-methylase UbiE